MTNGQLPITSKAPNSKHRLARSEVRAAEDILPKDRRSFLEVENFVTRVPNPFPWHGRPLPHRCAGHLALVVPCMSVVGHW